jgi:hypothetical protein
MRHRHPFCSAQATPQNTDPVGDPLTDPVEGIKIGGGSRLGIRAKSRANNKPLASTARAVAQPSTDSCNPAGIGRHTISRSTSGYNKLAALHRRRQGLRHVLRMNWGDAVHIHLHTQQASQQQLQQQRMQRRRPSRFQSIGRNGGRCEPRSLFRVGVD